MEKSRKKFNDLVEKAEAAACTMRRDELLFSYNGILYPTTLCSPETFRALESFEARSDDIMLAAYPKCVVWGCYFEYLSQWNKYADEENVMTITYEELKENRLLGVKKIAAFLEISLTEEELQLVVERSSFQAMKKNSQKTHGAIGDIVFRKGRKLQVVQR
ncbi:sulfotransferase 6B1-like [Empidonax traillii]|uniref:sulfotransferase 6B1-like n=1 Tax=Empidonax traillii TaxID=164674 RepID=UPI000FFD92E5|nr:sulfotransferase 6B1-like [Empidonax traillii]